MVRSSIPQRIYTSTLMVEEALEIIWFDFSAESNPRAEGRAREQTFSFFLNCRCVYTLGTKQKEDKYICMYFKRYLNESIVPNPVVKISHPRVQGPESLYSDSISITCRVWAKWFNKLGRQYR